MKKAFANLTGDLAGTYYPLTGMEEKVGNGVSNLKGLCLETKLVLLMYENNLSSNLEPLVENGDLVVYFVLVIIPVICC